MNEEADETALVGPVNGKFCFKKQTDGMVSSVVVGCAGAPCIEATVLAAVGPIRILHRTASDPPLSVFCLFLYVLSIKRHKKIH